MKTSFGGGFAFWRCSLVRSRTTDAAYACDGGHSQDGKKHESRGATVALPSPSYGNTFRFSTTLTSRIGR